MFFKREDIRSVCIPNSVKVIEREAFSFCNLYQITIPNSVTKIENRAFMGCVSLTNCFMKKNSNVNVYSNRVKKLVIDSGSGVYDKLINVIDNSEDKQK